MAPSQWPSSASRSAPPPDVPDAASEAAARLNAITIFVVMALTTAIILHRRIENGRRQTSRLEHPPFELGRMTSAHNHRCAVVERDAVPAAALGPHFFNV